MERQALDPFDAFLDQLEPVAIGKERSVLGDHEQVQPVAGLDRLLDQIAMAAGEGIGVDHRRTDLGARLAQLLQAVAIAADADRRVFHQRHQSRRLDDPVEAAAGEERDVVGTRIEEEMAVTAFEGEVKHFVHHLQAQVLAAKQRIDGDALDDILFEAAAGDHVASLAADDKNLDPLFVGKPGSRQEGLDLALFFRFLGRIDRVEDKFVAHLRTSLIARPFGRARPELVKRRVAGPDERRPRPARAVDGDARSASFGRSAPNGAS